MSSLVNKCLVFLAEHRILTFVRNIVVAACVLNFVSVANCFSQSARESGTPYNLTSKQSVEMIRVVNSILSTSKPSELLASEIELALAEGEMSEDDLMILLPLLFPGELQNASQLPENCWFATNLDGVFRWKYPFCQVVEFEGFPVEYFGMVFNVVLHKDAKSVLKWLGEFGVIREEEMTPPNNLVDWIDRFFESTEFTTLENPAQF